MRSAGTCWKRSAVPDPSEGPDLLGLRRGGEGAITGTVVCAAAIAYSAGHVQSTAHLSLVILGTVAVYWVAHLHAVTLGNARAAPRVSSAPPCVRRHGRRSSRRSPSSRPTATWRAPEAVSTGRGASPVARRAPASVCWSSPSRSLCTDDGLV